MTQPQSTTTARQPPANPDQRVPMVHANTQNNHTTLVIISAHYGSHMLTNTMVGFDSLMEIYTAIGTITEGQLYTALWPEVGLLDQAALIFGPEVMSYTPARNTFSIRVGTSKQYVDIQQMQRIVQALAVLDDTALARRAVYLACTVGLSDLHSLIADCDGEDEMRLITYARRLHNHVPDIDEQLVQIATALHRPMRHGVTAQYHQTSTLTQHGSHAATLPAYIGRDGGICTDTVTLYHGDKHEPSEPVADRIITANPVVLRSLSVDDLGHPPTVVGSQPKTTVELCAVLPATTALA